MHCSILGIMFKTLRAPFPAILLALAGFSLFSIGDCVVKMLGGHYDTFTIAFYVGLGVVLLTVAAAPFMGGMRPVLTVPDRKLHILRGALLAVEFYLIVYGFTVMSLAKTYALIFAAPMMTVLLAWPLLKERASPPQLVAIIAGFAGVLVILRPGVIPVDWASAGVVLAALLYALSNIVIRKMKSEIQPPLSWPFYAEIMIMLGAIPFFIMNPAIPEPLHLLGFLFVSATALLAMMTLGMAFRLGPTGTVASFHYVQMIWAVALGYMLFGDIPDRWTLAGSALIVASGIALIRLSRGRAAPAPDIV